MTSLLSIDEIETALKCGGINDREAVELRSEYRKSAANQPIENCEGFIKMARLLKLDFSRGR